MKKYSYLVNQNTYENQRQYYNSDETLGLYND